MQLCRRRPAGRPYMYLQLGQSVLIGKYVLATTASHCNCTYC